MITLRCTKKAREALRVQALPDAPAGTSPLGDWYVNLVPTVDGGFYLFTNEQSLLSVVFPRQGTSTETLQLFVARVGNLLSMIGVSNARIEEELEHFRDVRVAKTASRRILGVMNDFTFHLQDSLEESTTENKLSLSDFECQMADMPQATLGWQCAGAAALDLLKTPSKFGAV